MLARRSQIRLPDGTDCDLPLLIPSFSSKGSGFRNIKRGRILAAASGVSADLRDFQHTPSTSVLISAFDLHFRHFQLIDNAPRRYLDWIPDSRIIFLDSGGYELSPDFDSSEPKSPPYTPRLGYSREQYLLVLTALLGRSKQTNLVASNFDWGTRGQPLQTQIRDARAIRREYPHMLHSFIIKPWSRFMETVDPRQLSAEAVGDLSGFDILGVTEKELGADLLERLRRVARLRLALDRSGSVSPIHVWGGLDPVLTPLYFFAGAEIFDGVSWLRYAFVDGLAVTRESAAILDLELGVQAQRRLTHPMTAMRNRTFLDRLSACLQQWVDFDGKDFAMFPATTRDHLARAYGTMLTKIPEMKESRRG